MTGWQISETGKLEKINKVEMLDGVDSVKVKITRTLLTAEDVAIFSGENKGVKLPIIPGRMAVGQITELGSPSPYIDKGTKVFISPVRACGSCYHCTIGMPEKCYNFSVGGENTDGFLKDFAVVNMDEVYPIPASVKEGDAVYLEFISLAMSVIDKLEIEKGQHVVILGATVLGSILAQLIIYYQGVPIIIDDNADNLLLAKKSGIYYTVNATNKVEKEISAITGGRMASKVVYVARSGLSTDLAFKVAAPCAKVAFAGFAYPNIKVPLNIALIKQLTTVCVTNGYGNAERSINILATKAIDLSHYSLPVTKMEDIEKNINAMAKALNDKKTVYNLLINMLG